jgi:N-acetylneuraminate synthase
MDYRKKIELGKSDYGKIDMMCWEHGISWFASVWDVDSAKFFSDKGKTDIIKIPSAKITDKKLLTFCKDNFEKIIISTGMSTEKEIGQAVELCDPDVIFHSVASYPTEPEDIHLEYITKLQSKYPNKEIGYSGHELGVDLALLSIPLGVKWIEKHITLDRNLWGSDQKISIEPKELFELSEKVRRAEKCFSNMNTEREVLECEKEKRRQLRG